MSTGADSPASTSSSRSGSPPLTLDPNTLALLDSFLTSQAEEKQRFDQLAEQTAASLAFQDDEPTSKPMMSVEDYATTFREDWQLSQFWYKPDFARRFARCIHALCSESTRVAFLCCPTAFVAFQNIKPFKEAYLLEVDKRFAALAGKQYIFYDLDEPDVFPETYREHFDLAIIDPPFLNERTNAKLAQTLCQILRRDGKLMLITSTSVEDALHSIYAKPPLGPLRKARLAVEHGQLVNEFACWGSWDGAEDFGKDLK